MAKIIFFQAHPDDLEFNCGHLMHFLSTKSKKKHVIKIASVTKGEFGLPGVIYDKFKGDFLAKVRERELENAQSIHSIDKSNFHYFGYIDGLVYFTKEFVQKITDYLKKERPDIIVGPEPIYTYYYHMDHVNTGRALFHIIYKDLLGYKPKLYYYSALNPNTFFGFVARDIALIKRLMACHKTQFWLMSNMMMAYKPLTMIAGLKLKGWKYAEGYRQVFFKKNNLKRNKPSLKTMIFSHFFSSLPFYEAKYPEAVLKELKAKKGN